MLKHRGRTSPSPSYCTATLPKKFSKRSNPTQRGTEKGLTELTRVGTGREHRQRHPSGLQHSPKSFPRNPYSADRGNIAIAILLYCNTAQKCFPRDRLGKNRELLKHLGIASPSYCTVTLHKKFSKRIKPYSAGERRRTDGDVLPRSGQLATLSYCTATLPKKFFQDIKPYSAGKK